MFLLDVCVSYLGGSTGIPEKLAYIVGLAVRLIQIVVPILLILWGMLDLGKAVIAQKEEEIKKGQNTFIKRLVAAVVVFFVITIVRLVVSLFADDSEKQGMWECINEVITCKSSENCKG